MAMLRPTVALASGFELEAAPVTHLPEIAARLLRPTDAPDGAGPQLREGFRIGELGLMIRYEDGSELADLPPIYSLPNAPAWFHGMVNLHGALVPVFGLAEYLGLHGHGGLHSPDGSARWMLVMGRGADAAALLIEGLPQRLRFRAADLIDDAPVPRQLEAHVSATYWIDGQPWMDFKPAELFDRLETELDQAH
jgi:chemotaxis signal transduction protein